jgi:hypothetical protein
MFALVDYTREIIASGFPGIRQDSPSLRWRQLDSYVNNAVEHDIVELGATVRRPQSLRAWLTAYAAATATTAHYETILDVATPGEADKLTRATATVLAIEVKLSATVDSGSLKHLAWLESAIGPSLIDKVLINTGPFAHRLPDGTAVVPLALLGL